MEQKNRNIFYVYGLEDPNNDEIFYIGKGKGNRAVQHFNEKVVSESSNKAKIERIETIKNSGKVPVIHYYAENLSESAALALEEILINRVGRSCMNHGPLTNLTIGGARANYKKFHHDKDQMLTLEDIQSKYPELISIIKSVPKTSVEYEILNQKELLRNDLIDKINSADPTILTELNVSEYRVIIYPGEKKAVQHIIYCDLGHLIVHFRDEPYEIYDYMKITTSDNERLFDDHSNEVSNLARKVREFIRDTEN